MTRVIDNPILCRRWPEGAAGARAAHSVVLAVAVILVLTTPSCCGCGYRRVSAEEFNALQRAAGDSLQLHKVPWGDSGTAYGHFVVDEKRIEICISSEERARAKSLRGHSVPVATQ